MIGRTAFRYVSDSFIVGIPVAVVLVACCGCAPRETVRSTSTGDFPPGVCRIDGGNSSVRLNPECIQRDVGVMKGTALKELGTVGLATFDTSGVVKSCESGATVFAVSPETSGVTGVVGRRLLEQGVPMVERDPAMIDEILKELHFSTSDLVEQSLAPSIGKHLGVKTLVVGRFEYSGSFHATPNEAGELVVGKAERIAYQALRIKFLDVENGRILVDARFSIASPDVDILVPKLLASFGMQQILARMTIDRTQEAF